MSDAHNSSPYADDRIKVTTGILGMLRHLWPYFVRHRLLSSLILTLVISAAAAGRIAVWLFGYAIDHGISRGDQSVVRMVALAYFFVEAGRCLINFLQGYLFAKVGNRILYEIRDELMHHMQSLPIVYFDKNPTGRIVTRVTSDVVSLGEVFTQGLINLFSASISLIAILSAMMLISLRLTLATILIAPPLIWALSRISMSVFIVQRESRKKLAALNSFLAENVNGMRILQLYGKVSHHIDLFNQLSAQYRAQQITSVRRSALLWPLVSFFSAASVATALYFGGGMVLTGAVSTGAIVAFIMHVRAFSEPLNTILEQYQTLQNSLSGAERVFTVLAETRESEESDSSLPPNWQLRGEISFDHLSFRYGNDLPWALRDLNLRVPQGASVALVGRTGSGKSTLISLLQRFYEPTEGSILVDGLKLDQISRRRLRERMGVVQQDTFLFRGTIASNISFGDPRISRSAIERAAEMACLTELISRRAKGIDAEVEERGANLSVGERQLIAFARILAFAPDILILDEATANIDSKTEGLIQEATKRVRQGRTSFLIAHRLSTVIDCDLIVVIDQGKLVEKGTHHQLLEQNGVYAGLYHSRLKNPTATEARV